MTYKEFNTLIKNSMKSQFVINFVLSFLVNFIMEILGRGSFKGAFEYLTEQPLVFFFNMALILLSLSFVFLIKKRTFGVVVISTLWLSIGVINGIMLGYRITPFTVVDLTLISSAFSIMGKYLSFLQQIFLYVIIILVIILFFVIFLLGPKYKGKLRFRRNLILLMLCIMGFYSLTKGALASGVVSRYFGNIAFAYKEYGVPYCFTVTFVDRGIKMPVEYNNNSVQKAATRQLAGARSPITIPKGTITKNPNIIFIQLESFFDPTLVEGLTFSQDPIPNFRKMKNDFSSGYLNVPVVGAGTCNTEFEVITGMNMDFFGPGEYPYKSILKESTSESMAYNLKNLGYSTHAMHNNDGNFYGRNKVFSRLGFDTYTSIEYMKYVTMNPIGWAKDKVLTREIMNILNSTKEKDLIYTVSVQAHGNYPSSVVNGNPIITVEGIEEEGSKNAFEYYLSQINEMDEFLARLVEKLSDLEEDTILVLYGDHLPSLGLAKEDIKSNSIYKTEYIIWDNFGLEKKDMNLQAYQLSAAVQSRVGIDEGTLTAYHQKNMGAKKYQKNLRLLQYDMLYGKQYVYGQTKPFKRTDIKMGIEDILVSFVEQEGKDVFAYGQNFTEYSSIYVNGDKLESRFIDENTIEIADYTIKDNTEVTVKQHGSGQSILSSSDPYVYILPR